MLFEWKSLCKSHTALIFTRITFSAHILHSSMSGDSWSVLLASYLSFIQTWSYKKPCDPGLAGDMGKSILLVLQWLCRPDVSVRANFWSSPRKILWPQIYATSSSSDLSHSLCCGTYKVPWCFVESVSLLILYTFYKLELRKAGDHGTAIDFTCKRPCLGLSFIFLNIIK